MNNSFGTIESIIENIFHTESVIMSNTSCSICITLNNRSRNNNNWPIARVISPMGLKIQPCHKFYKLSHALELATNQASEFFALAYLLSKSVSEKYENGIQQYIFQMHYIRGALNACDVIIQLQENEEYILPAYRKIINIYPALILKLQNFSKSTLNQIFTTEEKQCADKDNWLKFYSDALYISAQTIKLPLQNKIGEDCEINSYFKKSCEFLNYNDKSFLLVPDKININFTYLTRYFDIEKNDLALIASSEDKKQNIILTHQAQYPLL